MLGLQPGAPLRTILCLGAHSDDIEIGCGGALLRLIAEHPDAHVWWVVLSGDAQRAREGAEWMAKWKDAHPQFNTVEEGEI